MRIKQNERENNLQCTVNAVVANAATPTPFDAWHVYTPF